MTSQKSMHLARWTLVHPTTIVGPLAIGNAIPDYFIANASIGSPINGETDWDEVPGGRIQTFTGGVVGWTPDTGARVLSD